MTFNPTLKTAGRPSPKKTTLQDVADYCGLSKSIVAQVLRNDERCRASERTRAAIRSAAEKLAYQPDLQAKGIATRKSYLLGVLSNNSVAHNFSRLIGGIQTEAASGHYSVVYYAPSTSHESELDLIRQAVRRQVDVLIIVPRDEGRTNADRLLEVHRNRTRIVQLMHRLHPDIPSITIDFRRLAYEATKRLIDHGHKRILHINYGYCIKSWSVDNDSSWQKVLGYRQAMDEAGLEAMLQAVPSVRCSSLESLCVNARETLEGSPTGIMVMNCSGAYGLVAGLKKIGMRVPEDVSVVACEDDYVLHPCFFQQLSSARFDFEEMGRLATQMSFGLLNGEHVKDIVLCPEFVERQTTGPAGK